jgi:hypothetical protein
VLYLETSQAILAGCFKKMLTHRLFRTITDIAPRVVYQTKIPGSATIMTTPRRGETLDATRLDGCSSRFSPFSIDQSTMQKKQLME